MSATLLKILALLFMTIDHIGEFFPNAPIWFRWIGRLSAPMFLYVFVNSLMYTKNKKKMLSRLYFFNIIICIINIFLNISPLTIVHELWFANNILGTFFALAILIYLFEYIKEKKDSWKKYLLYYILLQIIGTVFAVLLGLNGLNTMLLAFSQLTGNIFINEGRLFFTIVGVTFYFTKNNKKNTAFYYGLLVFINSFIILTALVPRISVRLQYYGFNVLYEVFERIMGVIGYDTMIFSGLSPLFEQYQWMMIFALPFILLYNGEKGRGFKYLFYIYYPLHIAILALLSYFYYF